MSSQVLTLDQKHARLTALFHEMGSLAVAFSAGVDSTLVLKVALDALGSSRVVAVTGKSDSLARAEFQDACALAEQVGAQHVVIDTGEFENPNYTSNPTNRCYFCKTTLYEDLTKFISKRGLNWIVNGANVDDLGDYRPGMQAASEHRVRSPLVEAEFTKSDVRELSRRLGLPTFDKPASPCLSSRVPYGEEVTPHKLRMIEDGESFLRTLGFRVCRIRHHQNDVARVEVPENDISRLSSPELWPQVESQLHSLGYTKVILEPRGFRSGSLNEMVHLTLASRVS